MQIAVTPLEYPYAGRNPFRRWLIWWHGQGEPWQAEFYRCLSCRGLVTWRHLHGGGCACGGARVSPTRPRLGEQFRLLCLPWSLYLEGGRE